MATIRGVGSAPNSSLFSSKDIIPTEAENESGKQESRKRFHLEVC
jgi:hypothetical protein